MLSLIIEHKESLKLLYSLVIILICTIIVLKTDRLFRLSSHKGIQYFRNAFLFYALAFAVRYLLGALMFYDIALQDYFPIANLIFEFFLVMAGFFLLYSLLWKKIEPARTDGRSSLLNTRLLIFYLMAFVIAILDHVWRMHTIMFFSQIIIFAVASILSGMNCIHKAGKHSFPKFYFLAMMLGLLAWILNAIAELYFNWSQDVLIGVYAINLIFFLLFLYGIFRVIRYSGK